MQSVGPKVALAVLSGGTPRELVTALANEDVARLQATPGIGKRTAERIIVELREKVAGSSAAGAEIVITRSDDPRRLARDGLVELGFTVVEADELLRDAPEDTPENLISSALRAVPQPMSPPRIQTPQRIEEELELDRSLRPRRLEDFVGQPSLKEQLAISDRGRAWRAARRSTTSCSPARPASARRRSRRSSPPSSTRRSS